MHRDVVHELSDNLVHGKGLSASSEALAQAHLKRFHDCELRYYNMRLWERGTVFSMHGPEKGFGVFADPNGYNGFYPSPYYLSAVWTEWMQRRPVAKLDRLVKGVEGEV